MRMVLNLIYLKKNYLKLYNYRILIEPKSIDDLLRTIKAVNSENLNKVKNINDFNYLDRINEELNDLKSINQEDNTSDQNDDDEDEDDDENNYDSEYEGDRIPFTSPFFNYNNNKNINNINDVLNYKIDKKSLPEDDSNEENNEYLIEAPSGKI